jgi:putative FmdB family regulatory protein
MPLYDYHCPKCRWFEARRGVEDYFTPCPQCGTSAKREAVYAEQYTRTESGGMQGRMGKAGDLSEGAERIARNSMAIEKETGRKSGPVLR